MTDAEVSSLVSALSVKAGRFRLSNKVLEVLAPYLVITLELKTLDDVESLGSRGFEMALYTADENDLIPEPLKVGALEWFAAMGAAPTEEPPKAGKTPAKGAGSVRKPKEAYAATDDDDDLESLAESTVGDFGSSKMIKDLAAQKLSKGEVQALHRSVFKGRVVPECEVIGVPYGQDCQYTEWARQLKKSGVVSFVSLLATRDYAKVKEHLITLIREYNEKGYVQEVTVLTTRVTSAEEMFVGDDKALCSYWEAYWKYYQGRGFPKEIDLYLVVRSMRNAGSTQAMLKTVQSLEEDFKKFQDAKVTVSRLELKMGTLERKVESLTTKINSMGPVGGGVKGGGGGDKGDKRCSYCQEVGHFFRNCPKRIADEAEKAKEAGDEAEA